jgi:predicted secreted Zn-dependent protease
MLRILCVLILFTSSYSFSQQRVILTWDSFTKDRPANAEHQALIAFLVVNEYKARPDKGNLMEVKFNVKAVIDTSKSYFNFNLKNKDYKLLNHEQGHADIATIYALKLKNQFDKTKYFQASFHAQIKQIYAEIDRQLGKQQKQYDDETNHGLNELEQERWDLILKKELNLN